MIKIYKLLTLTIFFLLLIGCSSNKSVNTPQKKSISDRGIIAYSMGDIARLEGDPVSAVTLLIRSYKESENNRVVLENLAESYLYLSPDHKKKYSEVVDWIKIYLDEVDFDKKIAEKYAVILFETGRHEESEEVFLKLAEIYPTDVGIIKLLMLKASRIELEPFDFERLFVIEADSTRWSKIDPMLQQEYVGLLRYMIKAFPEEAETIIEKSYGIYGDKRIFWLWFKLYYDRKDLDGVTTLLESHFEKDKELEREYLPLLLRVYLIQNNHIKINQYYKLYPNLDDKDSQRIYLMAALDTDIQEQITNALKNYLSYDISQSDQFEVKYFASNWFLERNLKEDWLTLSKEVDLNSQLTTFYYSKVRADSTQLNNVDVSLDSLVTLGLPSAKKNVIMAEIAQEINQLNLSEKYLLLIKPNQIDDSEKIFVSYLWFKTGKYSEADTFLGNLDDPKYAVNFIKGDLYRSLELDSLASDWYWKAVNQDSLSMNDYFSIGSFFEHNGAIDKLIKTAEKSYEYFPDTATALNYYGYSLLIYSDNIDLAEDLIIKAFDKEPENDGIRDSMGWLRYKQGRYRLAREFFDKLINQEVNNSEVAYHIGELYLKLENEEEAKKMLELAIELNNHKPSVERAEKTLNELNK
jgi:tetratricopeptide (TPR) repeat protein